MKFWERVHARLGDLWWYAILLFIAQRFCDAINIFVGLWLVPKYVPARELGAILPLSQAVSLVGLPLGILAIPFMKFLGVYAARNELGKVKALLRDVFIGTALLALLTVLIAWGVLPLFFERVRVMSGSLGFLIVLGSVVTAVSGIFGNAVQGLKLYDATVWFNLLSAPARFLSMLLTMPFRALSGYFIGQTASPAVSIIGAVWVLRKKLGRSVKAVSYWREDHAAMLRYTVPVAVNSVLGTVAAAVETLVIRHRLSDFESAGYYVITRFTDISACLGNAFIMFLFPMVAGLAARNDSSRKILLQSLSGTALSGLLVCVALFFGGGWILSLQSMWAEYVSLSGLMMPICLLTTLSMSANCLIMYEMAQGRFRFLLYGIPLVAGRCVFLYAVTGLEFFRGILPDRVIAQVEAWQPCTLSFVVGLLIVGQIIYLLALAADVLWKRRAE